jgi:hypothetical protein
VYKSPRLLVVTAGFPQIYFHLKIICRCELVPTLWGSGTPDETKSATWAGLRTCFKRATVRETMRGITRGESESQRGEGG